MEINTNIVEQKLKGEEKNNWGGEGKFNNPYLIGKKKTTKNSFHEQI